MLPGLEAVACPDMAVSMDVMQHVVNVESSRNPFAIGVVGGALVRQPRHLDEALATVRMLEEKGYNFSLGLAQVNRYNLARYGLESYERAFQICPNLQAGARILAECYSRSGNNWGKSFSCYYSGNFETGFRHGYVQKIFRSIDREARTGRGGAHCHHRESAQGGWQQRGHHHRNEPDSRGRSPFWRRGWGPRVGIQCPAPGACLDGRTGDVPTVAGA